MGRWTQEHKETEMLVSSIDTGSIRDPPKILEEDFEVADRNQSHAEQTRQAECRAERSELWRIKTETEP